MGGTSKTSWGDIQDNKFFNNWYSYHQLGLYITYHNKLPAIKQIDGLLDHFKT